MTQYWCVNFEEDAEFRHGIKEKLWLMGYQYGDNDSANRKGRITMNWQRLEEVHPGDQFVAYRKTNTFFATGTVRMPRRAKTADDHTDTVKKYLKRRESYDDGYIYFDGTVAYEDFTDELHDCPVRIDVESWDYYVRNGVVLPIVNKIPVYERHMAVMKIDEADFNLIVEKLAAKGGSAPKHRGIGGGVTVALADSVVEALEESHARGQGFRLDSKLRKAIEDYAMQAATQFFKSREYDVKDCSKGNPYDLGCAKKNERLYVEVKGTQSDAKSTILTWNEVEFARSHKGQMALFVLHSIKVSPDGEVTDGKEKVIWPWDLDKGCLKPIAYNYELPDGDG